MMTPEAGRSQIEFIPGSDLIKMLNEAEASRKRELADWERFNTVRNFYLGELGYSLKANEVGGAKDAFLYDENNNKVKDSDGIYRKFKTTWTPKLTTGGQILPQGKEQSLLKFLEEKYEEKALEPTEDNSSESEVNAFLRKARNFSTGEKLTEDEKKIAEKDFYLKKLDGYQLKLEKWTKGLGKAIFKNQKAVNIVRADDTSIVGGDGKPFKINWTTGIPSQELLEALRKEYEGTIKIDQEPEVNVIPEEESSTPSGPNNEELPIDFPDETNPSASSFPEQPILLSEIVDKKERKAMKYIQSKGYTPEQVEQAEGDQQVVILRNNETQLVLKDKDWWVFKKFATLIEASKYLRNKSLKKIAKYIGIGMGIAVTFPISVPWLILRRRRD